MVSKGISAGFSTRRRIAAVNFIGAAALNTLDLWDAQTGEINSFAGTEGLSEMEVDVLKEMIDVVDWTSPYADRGEPQAAPPTYDWQQRQTVAPPNNPRMMTPGVQAAAPPSTAVPTPPSQRRRGGGRTARQSEIPEGGV